MKAPCSIKDCDIESHARSWCVKHYTRWRRTGDPLEFRTGHRQPRTMRTHCKNGHRLSGDNVRIRNVRGGAVRVCKTCSRDSVYAARAKARAARGCA